MMNVLNTYLIFVYHLLHRCIHILNRYNLNRYNILGTFHTAMKWGVVIQWATKGIEYLEKETNKNLDSKTANVDELDAIREEAVEEIKEAVEFAKNAPFPDESVAFQDNYAD